MHSLEAAASAQEPLHTLPCGALCMLFMMRGTSSSRALLCIALLCSPCRAANLKTLFALLGMYQAAVHAWDLSVWQRCEGGTLQQMNLHGSLDVLALSQAPDPHEM